MPNQRWDYPTMNAKRNEIGVQAGVFDGITSKMDGVVSVLNRALEGDSLKEYQASHSSVMGQYQKLKEILQEMQTSLGNAVKGMQEADAENAARIRSRFSKFM